MNQSKPWLCGVNHAIASLEIFKEGAQEFIVEILSKLFERSSLGSQIFGSPDIFDPAS